MVRKSKARQHELWIRTVAISSLRVHVSSHATEARKSESVVETKFWLHLVGLLDEGIRDVRDIEMQLYPEDEVRIGPARPAAVGAIIGFRPHVQCVASFTHRDFDRLGFFALSGHLKYARLVFTKPRYNSARVTSLSFATEPEE